MIRQQGATKMEKKWLVIQLVVLVLIVAVLLAVQERRFNAQQALLSEQGRQIASLKNELASVQDKTIAALTDKQAGESPQEPVATGAEVEARLEQAEKTAEEASSKVQEMLDEQNLLKELATDMQDRKAQRQIATMMQARHEKILDDDIAAHGKELYELYKKSLPKEGVMNLFDGESDTAFKELVAKYPTAQTTAVAVAERALACAARQDTEGATEYYNMLMNGALDDTVVTSKGVEATPALLGYFTSQYARNGDYAQAQEMLNYLSENYTDSTLALRGPGGEPVYSTVDDFVQRMGNEINRSQR